ncbi:putative RNA-binding Zn ribbon-like protein [Frigoribacterium sp. UYMn621]|jgi:predicted RNA-binding Zn ribbon-like protein
MRASLVTDYIGYMFTTDGRPTGQEMTLDDGRDWWFDSGSLAIDFAYTGAMTSDRETLHAASDLTAWLTSRFPEVVDGATDRDLVDARALRGSLARAALARSSNTEIPSDDVDVINLFAATPDIAPSLVGGTRQAGRSRAKASQALSVLAREAVELFAANPSDRIRECAADDCDLVFYDESRSNNRRWCSMQRCGNRAKVRAHRARTSEDAPPPE